LLEGLARDRLRSPGFPLYSGVMRRLLPSLVVGIAFVAPAVASEPVEFERDVLPILRENCFKCHGGTPKLKGGLRLTSRDGILKGGIGGAVVDVKSPEKSRLVRAVAYDEERLRMPPSGKLDDSVVETLQRWIAQDLPWSPTAEYGVPAEHEESGHATDQHKGWSYKPVVRPAPPEVAHPDFVKNPIDAFVAAGLEKRGLAPAPPAEKRAFVRRATFDLLGLPPTPEDVEAFVADDSPDAVAKLIDRLLASPHYGENWGRHWLDLVRYADTNGFERDSEKPFIWRYRDYVVNALNADKPFDRFTREQLAGDELADASPESIAATGYYRLMQWDDEPPQGREQARYDVLDDIVKTTAETFLGMSMSCARCHDHKVDPITAIDYHRFLALFQGLTDYRTDGCLGDVSPPDVKAECDRLDAEKNEAIARIEAELEPLERDFARALAGRTTISGSDSLTHWRYTVDEPAGDWMNESFDASAWREGKGGFGAPGTPGSLIGTEWREPKIWLRRTFEWEGDPAQFALIVHHDDEVAVWVNGVLAAQANGYIVEYAELPVRSEGRAALRQGTNTIAVFCRQDFGGQYIDVIPVPDRERAVAELERYREKHRELDSVRARRVPRHYAPSAQERDTTPQPTHVLIRGNAAVKGKEVEPGTPAVLASVPFELAPPPQGATTSHRRKALADWIVDPRNPLTARVAVNRLWQFHFGRGIVRSSNDFGELGTRPTHPELLDWLASEFIARGWSLKAMHRLIMTSSTYAMSVKGDVAGFERDPINDSIWRFEARRLMAEEIRDSMLAVNGRLNPRLGGPTFFAPMPEAVLATASRPDQAWGVSPPSEIGRRSLYIKTKRSLLHPFLTVFDFADVDSGCPVRFTTTQPTQALALLNSPEVHEQARYFARRALAETKGDERAAIGFVWRLAFGRTPTDLETTEQLELLREQRELHGRDSEAAMQRLCLFVFNTNEFVYVD
jgi:Protein of unknown function (DUF1553)/Protein of unknown function (DUF1549)/Planctomycete cytochrome C